MPSSIKQKNTSCCIGGDPPSPDGIAPRPASSPNKLEKRTSKDKSPSCTKSDAAQLPAIFEDDAGTSIASESKTKEKGRFRRLITGDLYPADLLPIQPESPLADVRSKSTSLLNESFTLTANKPDTDDERDSVLEKIKAKKSSSTLKDVTKRLKKHFSRESALNKRLARSSVGTSEEEIERRAELRRIRERRIREELDNEVVSDEEDDAKSMSLPVDSSPKEMQTQWRIPDDEVLVLPTFPSPPLSPCDL